MFTVLSDFWFWFWMLLVAACSCVYGVRLSKKHIFKSERDIRNATFEISVYRTVLLELEKWFDQRGFQRNAETIRTLLNRSAMTDSMMSNYFPRAGETLKITFRKDGWWIDDPFGPFEGPYSRASDTLEVLSRIFARWEETETKFVADIEAEMKAELKENGER